MYKEIDTKTRSELCKLIEHIKQAQYGVSDRGEVMVSLNIDPRRAQLDPTRAQLLMKTLEKWGSIAIKRVDKGSVVKEDREEAPTLTYHLELNLRKFRKIEKELRSQMILEEENERKKSDPQPIQSVEFDDEKAQITVNGYKVQLPQYKNEHYLLSASFAYDKEKPVDWSELWKKVIGIDPMVEYDNEKTKKVLKNARDTVTRINRKIQSRANVSENILDFKNKSITRKHG